MLTCSVNVCPGATAETLGGHVHGHLDIHRLRQCQLANPEHRVSQFDVRAIRCNQEGPIALRAGELIEEPDVLLTAIDDAVVDAQ